MTRDAARLRASGYRDDTDVWETAWERRNRPRPRRRRRSFGSRVLSIFLILLVVVLAATLLLWVRAAAFNDRVTETSALSSALFLPLRGSERVNVLLVGYGGEGHDGAYLADSITVLSVDPSTGTTTTIPIPRDLWIEGVGELPQNGKVNEAFAIGQASGGIDAGGERLAAVLSDVTGLRIEHWMAIDFAGFAEMVDAVGGVTVDNPTAFAYTMNEQLHQSGAWNAGSFEAGEIRLNGDEALAYARARYTSVVEESTDYARSARQSRILAALKRKVGGGVTAIPAGLGLMNALEARLRTDLSVIDLALMSGHITSDRRLELTEDVALVATTNTVGQYILIPAGWTGPGDYGGLHAYIADALAQPIPSPTTTPATGAP